MQEIFSVNYPNIWNIYLEVGRSYGKVWNMQFNFFKTYFFVVENDGQ